MPLDIVGHAIVSADGRIADRHHRMPPELRNEADWTRFQAALDRAAMVVLGRLGHEAHPNPGRRRLVVTSRVATLDAVDDLVWLWNPGGLPFAEAMQRLGIETGEVAVTGGQGVFDLFLPLFTRFDLVTMEGVLIPDGIGCFSGGWPDDVLSRAGLGVSVEEKLDATARLQVWSRQVRSDSG